LIQSISATRLSTKDVQEVAIASGDET